MSAIAASGALRKMPTQLDGEQALYSLKVGDTLLPLNEALGQNLRINYSGKIECVHCGRDTNKSFNQGFCYPCFRDLAQCDSCIVSPEKCHYFEGTCREPAWADDHCMQDHIVYLANSSSLKVGITRHTQVPTRWIDQGATQALPVFRVSNRLQSGLVETVFKQQVSDRTSWQAMLKAEPPELDMHAQRDVLLQSCEAGWRALQDEHGLDAIQVIEDPQLHRIRFPVQQYPVKVKSFNLDKQPVVEGKLYGIKGQYLMLDTGVINIRKFGGYIVDCDITA